MEISVFSESKTVSFFLRKVITYGKIVPGVDACKYGKQWVFSKKAMYREYGDPDDICCKA